MKIQALGLICLLSGALAIPVPAEEQAQNSQVQPMQETPADPAPPVAFPLPDLGRVGDGDSGDDSSPEAGGDDDYAGDTNGADEPVGDDPGDDSGGDSGDDVDTDAMMMSPTMMHGANMDMDAFQEMVHQVQSQVQQIRKPPLSHFSPPFLCPVPRSHTSSAEQLAQQHSTDTNGLMEALVDPMSRLNQTMAMGVSRMALPAGGIGKIGGILGGAVASKKPAGLGLLSDLLRAISGLVEGLLTRGPVGNLLNDLLGGILSGIGGAAGGVLGGGAAAQVPNLIEGVLGSVNTILPGAGAVIAGAH